MYWDLVRAVFDGLLALGDERKSDHEKVAEDLKTSLILLAGAEKELVEIKKELREVKDELDKTSDELSEACPRSRFQTAASLSSKEELAV